jgi:hypothetical protein
MASPITMAVSTWYTGATIGPFGASGQVWLIIGAWALYCNALETPYIGCRVWNGAAQLCGSTVQVVNGANHLVEHHAIVTLTGATTLNLQAQNFSTGNGVFNTDGSKISAIRLS